LLLDSLVQLVGRSANEVYGQPVSRILLERCGQGLPGGGLGEPPLSALGLPPARSRVPRIDHPGALATGTSPAWRRDSKK
jgi:hypothetical protein